MFVPSPEENSFLRIHQIQEFCTLDPVRLGRTYTPRPCRFEGLVDFANLVGDLTALLEMEALHIGNRLVNAGYGGRVTDGSFGAIFGSQVSTMNASNADLAERKFLSPLGMARGNILF